MSKAPKREELLFHRSIGRWTLMLKKSYDGEMYGYLGSDSWTYRVTLTRNPLA